MSYGLRYPNKEDEIETNYSSWKPCGKMEDFMDVNNGKHYHEFIPGDYVVEMIGSKNDSQRL